MQPQSVFLKNLVLNIHNSIALEKNSIKPALRKVLDTKFPDYYERNGQKYKGHICPHCRVNFQTFIVLFIHSAFFHPLVATLFVNKGFITLIIEDSALKPEKNQIGGAKKSRSKEIVALFIELVEQRIRFQTPQTGTQPARVAVKRHVSVQQVKKKALGQKQQKQPQRSTSLDLAKRVLYHSREPFRRMRAEELQVQSEEQLENVLFDENDNEQIKDFEDIGQQEKQFFILWNSFIRRIKRPPLNHYKKYPDSPVPCRRDFPQYLETFIKEHHREIKELRVAFVMHLYTLYGHGFVYSYDIIRLLNLLEKTQ